MQEVKIVYARNPYLKVSQVVNGYRTEQRIYFQHISYVNLTEYEHYHELLIHATNVKIVLNIELPQRKITQDIFKVLESI